MTRTPDDRAQFARAQQALMANDLPSARAALEDLLERHAGDAQLCMMLAGVLMGQGHLRAATARLLESVAQLPADPQLVSRMARYMVEVGESKGARASLERPVERSPRTAQGVATMGMVWQVLGVPDRALALLEQAAELGFEPPLQNYFRGLQLMFLGRLDEARAAWRACLDKAPDTGRACLSLVRSYTQTDDDNDLDRVDTALARAKQGSIDHVSASFARFKVLDDLDRHDEAWTALARGSAAMARQLGHDPAQVERLMDAIIDRCDEAMLTPARDAAVHEGPMPIFIIGMPRSGTTLFERVLTSHSQVTSAGELNDFWRQLRWMADLHGSNIVDAQLLERIDDVDFSELGRRYLEQSQWRADGKRFYVDKLPTNCHVAGLIHRALPDAPILHMVRDPMDVCWSNFKAMFGTAYSYSYDLSHLAAYYHQYRRLMAHWHRVMPGAVLDVSYRDLVQDTENLVRKVLDFCGLPFEPGCLDLGRNRAPVMSLSSPQVREGIHARALGEWQRYASQLEPLRQALESA